MSSIAKVEQGNSDIDQYATNLGSLLSSAKPHKQLPEQLEINGWSKESVVDWLQEESRRPTSDPSYRRKCMKCLDVLVRRYHIFPSSFFIKDISLDGHRPKKRGGFADIYKGTVGAGNVCLKRLRLYLDYDESKLNAVISDFCKEALIWTQLSHPNILPFLGINADLFEPELCLVSPWIINDDIVSFLTKNPDHDRLQSICDIAAGLEYLHSLSPVIVHGDIKGGNVLVDENCNCLLSDFGLSKTLSHTTGQTTNTSLGGSVRWMAPELFDLDMENGERQYMSPRDIYAFGCTILEIMTGKPPFPKLHDAAVMHQIVHNHARPPKPADGWCPGDVWNLVERCWHRDPSQRPGATAINAYLNVLKEGKPGLELLLWHRIIAPEKSIGIAATINSLVSLGFSPYEVHKQMHKHGNKNQIVLPILRQAACDNVNAKQSEVLFYTSVAATTVKELRRTNVYYQTSSGQIVEARTDRQEVTTIFRAALFSPLAAINYNGGEEIRVYYLDQDSILQEYCRSGSGQWYFGDLGDLKVKAGYNTSLAAICWNDSSILQIRVFYQEFESNVIRAVGRDTGSWHKREMFISGAVHGTALSIVRIWYRGVPHIRIYYQDAGLFIREICCNDRTERCYRGGFHSGQVPRCTPIAVTCRFDTNLRVWWRNGRGKVVGSEWCGRHRWQSLGVLVSGLEPGTNFAVADLTSSGLNRGQPLTMAFYQNEDAHVVAYGEGDMATMAILGLWC